MNILMIDYEYPPVGGGGGVFNKQLAEALVRIHHYGVTVLTSGYDTLLSSEVRNGVQIERVPIVGRNDRNAASLVSMLSFFPASFLKGYQLLKQKRFDIVHSFFAIPSAPSGLILAKLFKRPHVISILGGDIYDPSKRLSPHKIPLLRKIVHWVLAQSDKVVSLSDDIKVRTSEHYDIPQEDIDKIFLGIPKPQFPRYDRSKYGFAQEDKILISIGRLVPRKAMHELIETVKAMEDPFVRLVIVGGGPERSRLSRLVVELNLTHQVLFTGNVSDEEKFGLLAISDLYVSTSTHEGFGIVFLEAMASGLPVVCYDCGGQVDYLKHETNGFVVPFGDRERFVQGVQQILSDNRLNTTIRRENIEYMKKFYIHECSRHYKRLYCDAISHRKTVSRSYYAKR